MSAMTTAESSTTATCDRREHRARPSRPSISRRGWRVPVLLALALVALLLQAAPAGAVVRGTVVPQPRADLGKAHRRLELQNIVKWT